MDNYVPPLVSLQTEAYRAVLRAIAATELDWVSCLASNLSVRSRIGAGKNSASLQGAGLLVMLTRVNKEAAER